MDEIGLSSASSVQQTLDGFGKEGLRCEHRWRIEDRTLVTVADFSRLVSGIYAAALAPQQWQVAIREIHRTIGGTGGSLLLGDGAVWSFHNSTLPETALESYAEHYSRLDYVLAAVETGPVGAVRTGPDVVLRNRNREFYADWMRPNELEDGLFVRNHRADKRPCCSSSTRTTNPSPLQRFCTGSTT